MRVAFDLDNTLIPCGIHFPTEDSFLTILLRPLFPEKIRKGSPELLKSLQNQGYEIWIYTSSQRPVWYLKVWFWRLGIHLNGIINLGRHYRVLRNYPSPIDSISKYPPAFGIDCLIDDSEGVVEEGRRYNFEVIHITPDNSQWAETVQAQLKQHTQHKNSDSQT